MVSPHLGSPAAPKISREKLAELLSVLDETLERGGPELVKAPGCRFLASRIYARLRQALQPDALVEEGIELASPPDSPRQDLQPSTLSGSNSQVQVRQDSSAVSRGDSREIPSDAPVLPEDASPRSCKAWTELNRLSKNLDSLWTGLDGLDPSNMHWDELCRVHAAFQRIEAGADCVNTQHLTSGRAACIELYMHLALGISQGLLQLDESTCDLFVREPVFVHGGNRTIRLRFAAKEFRNLQLADVKKLLCEQEGIDPCQQWLSFPDGSDKSRWKALTHDMSLWTCGVRPGSTLYLSVRCGKFGESESFSFVESLREEDEMKLIQSAGQSRARSRLRMPYEVR